VRIAGIDTAHLAHGREGEVRTMKYTGRLVCILAIALAGGEATAREREEETPPSGSQVQAAAPDTPVAAVENFHGALAAGDRERALAWLDPEVSIFESGGAERSREEYASHHLQSDMAFASSTKTEILNRETRSSGDVAWVLSRSRTTGTFRGRDVDVEGVETMVLRQDQGRWRIVHIHWSSRRRAD
jgi:ketosteroid isomerase-like protein